MFASVHFAFLHLCTWLFTRLACASFFKDSRAKTDEVIAIDQSRCGVGTPAFGFALVTLLLPIIGYTFLYCKIRNKDEVYDNKFLRDWGFMIIGYVSSCDLLNHE